MRDRRELLRDYFNRRRMIWRLGLIVLGAAVGTLVLTPLLEPSLGDEAGAVGTAIAIAVALIIETLGWHFRAKLRLSRLLGVMLVVGLVALGSIATTERMTAHPPSDENQATDSEPDPGPDIPRIVEHYIKLTAIVVGASVGSSAGGIAGIPAGPIGVGVGSTIGGTAGGTGGEAVARRLIEAVEAPTRTTHPGGNNSTRHQAQHVQHTASQPDLPGGNNEYEEPPQTRVVRDRSIQNRSGGQHGYKVETVH